MPDVHRLSHGAFSSFALASYGQRFGRWDSLLESGGAPFWGFVFQSFAVFHVFTTNVTYFPFVLRDFTRLAYALIRRVAPSRFL